MDKTSYKQRVDKICCKGKGKGGKFSCKDFLKIRNRIVRIGDRGFGIVRNCEVLLMDILKQVTQDFNFLKCLSVTFLSHN